MFEFAPIVLASDDDWVGWLLAIGPVGAASFYWAVWRAYRNTDKSHAYEHETEIVVSNMTGDDVKVGTNNGTRNSRIEGMNSDSPRQRV
jgi:hypothetical protein